MLIEKGTKMMLLTKENRAKLPPLYAQDGKGMDAIAYVKFFDPSGSFHWYFTEFDGKDLFFGMVTSHLCPEGELGYSSLSEIESIRGAFGLGIERDMHWTPRPLKDCKGS